MAELRLLGKEVVIRFTRSGVPQQTITAIKNFSCQYDIEEKSEGYLGETGDRQDEVFSRITGGFMIHPESPDLMELQKAIADRATRRNATDEVVSCTFRANFPNGQSRRVTIPDMKFGNLPFSVGARADYVDATFNYRAETLTLSQ